MLAAVSPAWCWGGLSAGAEPAARSGAGSCRHRPPGLPSRPSQVREHPLHPYPLLEPKPAGGRGRQHRFGFFPLSLLRYCPPGPVAFRARG